MFVPHFEAPSSPEGPVLLVSVHGSRVALSEGTAPPSGLFLGTLGGRHCWAVEVGPDEQRDLTDLYSLWGRVDEVRWKLAGRAVQLLEWQRTHAFCGRCGARTEPSAGSGPAGARSVACWRSRAWLRR